MIVVKIELHSATTGLVSEIGRMHISNDGTGTGKRGNYDVQILRRGARTGKWPIHPGEPEEFDADVRSGE